MLPAKSGSTVREFLALAVRATGVFSGLFSGRASSSVGVDRTEVNPSVDRTKLQVGSSTIELVLDSSGFAVRRELLVAWVSKAASAVAHYYREFPVPFMRVRVRASEEESGVFAGETWGSNPPFTRIYVGREASSRRLKDDWMMTHELVHTAFPDVADEHHWIEEGIATYVEPIARVQTGDLAPERIWADMLQGMPKGEPKAFDEGLDHTHTWGRTYWGGALFCLLADVRIRQATGNRKGLQSALRGISNAGGTIDQHWPLQRALKIGDEASESNVLTSLYSEMKDKPVTIDLSALWRELGVTSSNGSVVLSNAAPSANIRRSIESGNPV